MDGGGSSGVNNPTVASDTTPNPATCPADAAPDGKCTKGRTWLGTACCTECIGAIAEYGFFGCFSVNDATDLNLGKSLARYKDRMPGNTAPPYPAGASEDLKIGERVVIFGCDTVSWDGGEGGLVGGWARNNNSQGHLSLI